MSFICKECGPTKAGERRCRIATKIRKVIYNLQVKTIYADKEVVKTVGQAEGYEIVEEANYCQNHAPKEFTPQVVDKVVKKQLVKTILRLK